MKIYTLSALCLTFLLASCGGDNSEKEDAKSEEQKCFYSLNDESYELTWTAYKTNAKVGVGGTFDNVTFSGGSGESAVEAIEGIEFEIETASVNSQNEERDPKIVEHFFGAFNTPKITGKVQKVDPESGSATVMITMNGISYDVNGDFTMDGNSFSFKADIELGAWNGLEAVSALNEVCYDLHTGDDGVSKLWSEVAISFSGSLNEDCD